MADWDVGSLVDSDVTSSCRTRANRAAAVSYVPADELEAETEAVPAKDELRRLNSCDCEPGPSELEPRLRDRPSSCD